MQDIGSGIAYTYGIDAKGKMYIWDKYARRMQFYGDPKQGMNHIVTLSAGHNAKLNFEGDKTNGKWKTAGQQQSPASNTTAAAVGGGGNFGGGGAAPAPKVLDQAQLDSLKSLLGQFDSSRNTAKKRAAIARKTAEGEKKEEFGREKGKYEGKKLTTLQDFAGAKTDTDLNTRNTLENLISSLSTMGLGGSRALTRQILDAANQSNRKANATQATNNQSLDSAFNEYESGYKGDLDKISDQYGYDKSEADRQWAQNRQNTLYKMADVYNAADRTDDRQRLMNQGNNLNSFISKAAFVNPRYTGQNRAMATPELSDYTQDIAQYNTSAVGADGAGADGTAPGNMAIRAIALNDRDRGVKKKTEGDLAYGV